MDLQAEISLYSKRLLTSIFIGGGTPSLMPADFYEKLLAQVGQLTDCSKDIEITLEANPGTVDSANFAGFRQAGINRLSIGVQSFDNQKLQQLGRIHDQQQIFQTWEKARRAGFENINLDLMFALPQQTPAAALRDLQQAIDLAPEHLSWYQLTIEPNTPFYASPPKQLPDDDVSWEMQRAGMALLESAGYQQYEISAYAREGRQCRHNLNYWQFGDYAAIGAGAHAKVTLQDGVIERRSKQRSPARYQSGKWLSTQTRLTGEDVFIEYLMNRLRLKSAFSGKELSNLSGLSETAINKRLLPQVNKGFLTEEKSYYRVTEKGQRFLNEMLSALI